jgi:SAM-dependent methyltransferase
MADAPRTPADFEASYAGEPPWDVGRAQAEIIRLSDDGEIRSDVLDVGCGTGENALFLASRGHPVVGVDSAPTAIARATEKAAQRGLNATFLVHDALDLGALRHRFTSALDCGLFHVLGDPERRRYAESLARVLGSGGVLHLLCFSDEEPAGPGPRRISQFELRDAFRGPFVSTRIREARFENTMQEGGARAWLATFTRV